MRTMSAIATITLLGLTLSVPALAQSTTTAVDGQPRVVQRSVQTSTEDFTATVPAVLTAERLLDMDIADASGESVGDVEDVLVEDDGSIKTIIVDVGGFLGMGERTVAMEIARMHLAEDDYDELVSDMTREELEQLPAYERIDGGWTQAIAQEG